ncbi:MAG: hypothetical protein JNM56_11970 [Planctomycetia bacterium]|nr:hypothetical protein [Planctomycetia bacterium]
MLSTLSFSNATPWPAVVGRFLEITVTRPAQGFVDLGVGLVAVFVPLGLAAWKAAVRAVARRLSTEDCVQVEQGLEQLAQGCQALAIPLALVGVVMLFGHPTACGLLALLAFTLLV